MSNPTDLIPIGCLHERVNEQGDRYLTGSLGLARFLIVKSDQKADDASVIWDVLVQRDPGITRRTLRRQPSPTGIHPTAPDYLLPDPL